VPAATVPAAAATEASAAKKDVKAEAAEPATAAPEAKADKKTAAPDAEEIVSQIVQAFDDGAEDAGSSKSGSRSKRTCKMDVPYLDMVVSYPCED
jgi:hypothetical protein